MHINWKMRVFGVKSSLMGVLDGTFYHICAALNYVVACDAFILASKEPRIGIFSCQ